MTLRLFRKLLLMNIGLLRGDILFLTYRWETSNTSNNMVFFIDICIITDIMLSNIVKGGQSVS